MARVQRSGYSQRRGLKTKRLMTDVGISVKYKLDRIAEVQGDSKSGALNSILRETLAENDIPSWKAAEQQNAEMAAFTSAYIKEHFGDDPEDETLAMSEAIRAFYTHKGYELPVEQEDDNEFNMPDWIKP